jgi:acyl-CoA synthetase (AMP-forming)/AMP-acid ligase II
LGPGQVGELYSKGPMLFDEYYKLPEKTAAAFQGEWFSAGDMAMREEDGFFEIVDRKDNMIITGGEHVYPSEVEEVVGSHPVVFDVCRHQPAGRQVGRKVTAVVIAKSPLTAEAVIAHCRGKLAGYKLPKEVVFIDTDEMPRTATGKILHRMLRERYSHR